MCFSSGVVFSEVAPGAAAALGDWSAAGTARAAGEESERSRYRTCRQRAEGEPLP